MRLLNKIKNEFLNSNNLNKIIYINVLIFLLINIISVISTLYIFEIQPYIDKLTLPSETSKIITQPWSLFTFMFIHDNFLHLIFNMLWLHFGGKLFLDYLNEKQLIYTYILGGIFGGILFVIAFNISSFHFFPESTRVSGLFIKTNLALLLSFKLSQGYTLLGNCSSNKIISSFSFIEILFTTLANPYDAEGIIVILLWFSQSTIEENLFFTTSEVLKKSFGNI